MRLLTLPELDLSLNNWTNFFDDFFFPLEERNVTSSYDFDNNNDDQPITDFPTRDGLDSQFRDIDFTPSFDNNNDDYHWFHFDRDDQSLTTYPTPPTTRALADDSYSHNNYEMNDTNIFGIMSGFALICLGLSILSKCSFSQNDGSTDNSANSTSPRPNNNNNNNRTRNSNNNASTRQQAPESIHESQKQQQDSQAILRLKVIKVLFPEEKIDESKLKYDSEANSYRWTRASERNSTSCCICLEGFQEGDLILSGHCSHIYHRECVMVWVEQNDSCPVCRQPIFDEATYKAVEQQVISLDV